MRRLVACVSVAGAPGVTTLSLALAAAWPAVSVGEVRPVVLEADASGGDVAARLGRAHTPGLLDVAAAARRTHPGSLLTAVQELPFGVRAVLAPSGAGQCRAAVELLEADGGRMLRGDAPDIGTVIVDLGRVADLALDRGLVAWADAVVLVAGGGVDALAHVFACREALAGADRAMVLAVVGPCPYPEREIARALGLEHVVLVPQAPRSAGVLCGASAGQLRLAGWRRSALATAAERLGRRVLELLPAEPDFPGAQPAVAVSAGTGAPCGR